MEHIISRECPKAQAYIVPFVKGHARCVHIADAMDEAIIWLLREISTGAWVR